MLTKLTCHPGFHRTLTFIKQQFWWPTINQDTCAFVAACFVCAREKASHQAPAGLLHPLPVPSCPWSLSLVFLRPEECILTIVDRFSKAVHFVPLLKLPSATETADLLVLHISHIHGIPVDVVSDQGPQFSSQVWKAFCRALGTTVSLSSGYHPQTNGQTARANQDLETALLCVTERHLG